MTENVIKTESGMVFVERYIYHHATCCWVLAWIPKDEPYTGPPPGASLRMFINRFSY